MRVTASRLNVRSGPGTDFRVIESLIHGAAVDIVESYGDWAWVSPVAGWVSRAYLESEALAAPSGIQALRLVFGEPGSAPCSAGRVVLPAALKLGWQNARVTRVACHAKLEGLFTEVFHEIHREGLWHLLWTFDGIYANRSKSQSSHPSTHSWGIAVDLNAAENAQGSMGSMDSRIVHIFEERGFIWGGRWSSLARDPMHFQYAKDY